MCSDQFKNISEYLRQDKPLIGQRKGLSPDDVAQANRLYSCPNKGINGHLYVTVKNGFFEPKSDNTEPPNPYVIVEAVDAEGKEITQQTARKGATFTPEWKKILNFGDKEWQFFRISSWDTDANSEKTQLTMSQMITMTKTGKFKLKHCASSDCSSYVLFSYSLIPSHKRKSKANFYLPCKSILSTFL